MSVIERRPLSLTRLAPTPHGLILRLAPPQILLQREVSLIEHSSAGVRVHTRGGGDGIEADAVVVTVPLGVLKAN